MNSMKAYFFNLFDNAKKVFIVAFVIFSTLALFSYFFTQSNNTRVSLDTQRRGSEELYEILNDPKLNSTKEGKLMILGYRSLLCGLVGEACTNNPRDAMRNFDKSAFGQLANAMSFAYENPPASGVYWVSNGLQNAGLIPKTYAAEGVGFAALRPIEGIWKVFRDLAYILLVLVLIIIGFMIMFRVKVNPQTVVRLENSLPRIVLSLILITFSFAIAGFLIDLMYIVILVSITALANVNVGRLTPADVPSLQNKYMGAGMAQLWPFEGDPFQVGLALVDILPSFIKGVFKGIIAFFFTNLLVVIFNTGVRNFFTGLNDLGGTVGGGASFLGFGANGTFGMDFGKLSNYPILIFELMLFFMIFPYAAGILIGLIFVLTLLFFMFRLLFMLLGSYIKILLLVIFAPIILLANAIPGRNMFIFWIKRLVAELVTFPLVIIVMLVGYAITNSPLAEGRLFRPPFLYAIEGDSFKVIVGMGIVLLLPNLIKAVKEALGVKGQGLGFSPGIFFGGVSSATGGAMESLQKYYYSSAALKSLGGNKVLGRVLPNFLKGGGGGS